MKAQRGFNCGIKYVRPTETECALPNFWIGDARVHWLKHAYAGSTSHSKSSFVGRAVMAF